MNFVSAFKGLVKKGKSLLESPPPSSEATISKSKPASPVAALKSQVPPNKTSGSMGSAKPIRADNRKSKSPGIRKKRWEVAEFKVAPAEDKTRFHDLNLAVPVMHAIFDLGFTYCTPIQAEILPATLAGKDATGRAQTGTGKTAAFLITALDRMLKNPIVGKRTPGTPRMLVIAPTRELVLQISEEARQLAKYCNIKTLSVFGGMDYQKQQKMLKQGLIDIIVATPGRLLDFYRRKDLILRKVEMMVIDEADRMLDMGFIPDVRKIIYATPNKDKRQTLLFSATLTEAITRLAEQWTSKPVVVEIEPEQIEVASVEQIVYLVTTSEKFALLYNIITQQNLDRVLVFCNRRDEVRRLTETLSRYSIDSRVLSGEVPQKTRIRRLDEFKAGKIRVLVATDVAGRGIHIEDMSHVINYALPRDPEDYVHRIGRTGRAGAMGTSISFADEKDSFYLPPIEAFIDHKLDCIAPDEKWLTLPATAVKRKAPKPTKKSPTGPKSRRSNATGNRSRSSQRGPRSPKERPRSQARRPRPAPKAKTTS
jgi:ATP-dependent RNA helicase RhlB